MPGGEPRVNLVLAVLRATQIWGGHDGAAGPAGRTGSLGGSGRAGAARGARRAETRARARADRSRLVGLAPELPPDAADLVDVLEHVARRLVTDLAGARLGRSQSPSSRRCWGRRCPTSSRCWSSPAPRWCRGWPARTDEIAHILHALDGGYVPAGPSGSPTRGLVNVLPTGRNFYSVDPKAIPSRSAWEVGGALADSLLARHLADTGEYPRSRRADGVGHERDAHPGRRHRRDPRAASACRPVWDEASRRVTGFEIVPRAELGRPRIDVTVRISGFFRDAFPHVIALLDDAIAGRGGPGRAASNYLRAHVEADVAAHGDRRRATARVFGSKPGAYGAGLLPLIDARNWRSDADLAEVYAVWGGYAYGRGLDGREARADMETAFRRIAVAAKNQDTREHDIVDSDDYFQYHGGMVATVRALTGRTPAAVRRRLGRSRCRAHPHPRRGDEAGVPRPRGQPALDRRDAAPRLQGRVRAGGHRRLPLRLRRHRRGRRRLDVRHAWRASTCSTRSTGSSWNARTRGRCAASPSGCWRRPTAGCGPKPDDAVLDRLRATYLELEGDLEGAG